MRLIDRYLFGQLLGPTVATMASLSALALLTQSLSFFDLIVEQRQNAVIFLQLTLLAMPPLLSLLAPIALFVATLLAYNRLHNEQEIVVCFAGGMTRWRVISPAMRLAAVVALLTLAVNLFVQPLTQRTMRERLFAARTDLVTSLVREGQFIRPAENLTVYAREVGTDGSMRGLFINQRMDDGGTRTYDARRGRIVRQNGTPVLVMQQGAINALSGEGVLNYVTFDEYRFDLTPFVDTVEQIHFKASDRYLHELFFPDLRSSWERRSQVELAAEGHSRLSGPLYNIAFVLLALAAVLGGSFSRLGYGRRIAAMSAAAVGVRVLGIAVQAAATDVLWLNVLQYAVPLGASWWALRTILPPHRPARAAGGLQQLAEI